jgi:hypothetical protein
MFWRRQQISNWDSAIRPPTWRHVLSDNEVRLKAASTYGKRIFYNLHIHNLLDLFTYLFRGAWWQRKWEIKLLHTHEDFNITYGSFMRRNKLLAFSVHCSCKGLSTTAIHDKQRSLQDNCGIIRLSTEAAETSSLTCQKYICLLWL